MGKKLDYDAVRAAAKRVQSYPSYTVRQLADDVQVLLDENQVLREAYQETVELLIPAVVTDEMVGRGVRELKEYIGEALHNPSALVRTIIEAALSEE